MSKKRIRVIGLFIAVLSLAVLSGCGSAKKKQKATTKTTEVASTTEKENISKNKDQQTITSSATTEATTKVTTSTTTSTAKKTTKATTETPIATKKDEQNNYNFFRKEESNYDKRIKKNVIYGTCSYDACRRISFSIWEKSACYA